MTGNRRSGRAAVLSIPLALALLALALLGPAGLAEDRAARAAAPAATHHDADGSAGVLGLPPKVHVLVNRAVDGPGAPSTPVADATTTVAAAYPGAGLPPAVTDPRGTDGPPGSSWWGRAPPHTPV